MSLVYSCHSSSYFEARTIMKRAQQIFFILSISIIYCASEQTCNMVEDKSPNLQLKRYLFCDYDSSVRPADEHNNSTNPTIFLVPKLASFSDYSDSLELHAWLYISWTDPHLKWNPQDYSDVKSLFVKSNEIWTPDITILNSRFGSGGESNIPYTNCILSNVGVVVCVPLVEYTSRCITDYSFWPFDKHNCSFEFSSWSHSANEISIDAKKFTVTMVHYAPNAEWTIVPGPIRGVNKQSKYMSYEEFPMVIVDFSLERGTTQLWTVYILPIIILTVMTLTTLWYDAAGNDRLIIAIINTMCHFKCIEYIHWALPHSGSLPNILIFYHNSLVLAVLTLLLTCILRRVAELKTSPPPWISSYMASILSSKPGRILLIIILDPKTSARIEEDADDNTDLVGTQNSHKSTWNYVIVIVGWLAFMSFFFTYFIMFLILLHVPTSEN